MRKEHNLYQAADGAVKIALAQGYFRFHTNGQLKSPRNEAI